MGTYVTGFDITWDDLNQFDNWDAFDAKYGNWKAFSYNKGAPISLGGGHHGEIWQLNRSEEEDNQVHIYNITKIDQNTIEVTTDWNNFSLNLNDDTGFPDDTGLPADTIYLSGILGMVEANFQQYPIIQIVNNYTFRLSVPDTTRFSAYTSGGYASRVIPFSALFKKFNPYLELDKKVRCGWLYMYVDSSGTDLRRNVAISGVTLTDPPIITTANDHNFQTNDQINIFKVGGTTQINDKSFFITVLTENTFSLNNIDATGYTAYTSGGYASVEEPCKIIIDIITNDAPAPAVVNGLLLPFQGNCTNMVLDTGQKKWYKVFINQTGKFIQFRVRNTQAGSKIAIQATMPGFSPVGRII